MSAASQVPYRAKHVGVCPPARGAVIAALVRAQPAPVWIIVAEHARLAEQLAEDISFFLETHASPAASAEVLLFPESMPDTGDMREAFAASADRLTVLSALRARRSAGECGMRIADCGMKGAPAPDANGSGSSPIPHSAIRIPHSLLVLTTPAALLQPVPALEQFATAEFTLARGQSQSFQGLLEKLRALDYDSEAVCEAPGHYAIRGGIIDVYPVTATQPYRLDFFGDEIEDIRAFDPVTQRSGESVASITLSATPRVRLAPSKTGLADYLPARAANLLLVEPAALDAAFSRLALENASVDAGASPTLAGFLPRFAALLGVSDLDEAAALFDTPDTQENLWDTESLAHHRNYPSDGLVANERLQAEEDARARFLAQAATWSHEGYALAIVTAKEGEENRAKEILAADSKLKKLRPRYLRGTLNEGFRITNRGEGFSIFDFRFSIEGASAPFGTTARQRPIENRESKIENPSRGLVLVTETELFGRRRPRRPGSTSAQRRLTAQRAQVDQLLDFSELVEGDYVVHLQHGIAHYRGLTRVEHAGGAREVISLEFDDGVTLHVPLQESHLVSRYVGLGKTRPQLGRVGSGRWEKTRRAAELATIDLAAELLRIQASREARPGHAFDPDTVWQKEFEASFPFTETRDQLRAIDETKDDMERPRPMDRLICGDVGFGKTEVAIRAAFKAVQSGRQVALLVPTTVLAQQHLNTFRERMAGYPVNIEMVSRFRTRAEQNKIVAATAAGQVDILIGTHRILQKDIRFRELGLVIIDEEQRFGVKHKETLKAMRATVDVLSMSATPIPRTLYMAMTGARDMSVIETAPVNRHPVQTIVKTYDEKIIVEAVRREIRRGGQVFYLHNRVQTIDLVAARLRELLPDLDIGVGHGQMDEKDLERVMTDFVAGNHHVLVCTTIIESGLDIPNCNTIIIEGADRFGLSQLYQLRGRVGRFKHQAYAYLLLHRHTQLVEIARQRLNALRAHNQLGAGFRIAMRDLELRGAGNLLGPQQSGHIVGVGFELYCQLLRQSVARLKGEKQAAAIRATVKLDFVYVGEAESGADSPPVGRAKPPAEPPRHARGALPPHRTFQAPASKSAPIPQSSYAAIKAAEDDASGIVPLAPIQARIPVSYIAETRLRIDLYRRLALTDSPAALKEIEADLRDRFGPIPEEIRALLLVTEIRIRAEQKGILSVETESTRLKCLRNTGKRDDFIMHGARFPRLSAPKPLSRLREIITFLNNQPNP
ncbi:transcription-repair coupling factor [Termitidicoccus mucosus]|uniref:Transcription-repair-coupling factor n=1 Tax=Termitidicoccus mucosus TaxID=1184151 RepID=A0A178INZ3_9BACT|nr:transcription-repair coupling factor [Opitutaceae bacterium TSB47]